MGFIQLPGNHGDSMIYMATRQMLDVRQVDYRMVNLEEIRNERLDDDVDAIVIGGGGSLGSTYRWNFELRRRALHLGVPLTVLPQTVVDRNEDLSQFERVYAREETSAAMDPCMALYPDLALGLTWELAPSPRPGTGVYLRRDWERLLPETNASMGDPVELCRTVADYIALAGGYQHLVTDRLHFAIAGLMHGVDVTLLPCVYFKNRAMYDSWLSTLGCRWMESLDGLV